MKLYLDKKGLHNIFYRYQRNNIGKELINRKIYQKLENLKKVWMRDARLNTMRLDWTSIGVIQSA